MTHEVYICYDKKDLNVAEGIYDLLEENGIRSWMKSRDMTSDDPVEISDAISDSKCFLLVLSKNLKEKNFLITETDIAFSSDVPILVFNLDKSKFDGNLEFILENQAVVPHVSDSKRQMENLVGETSKVINKPVSKVKLNPKSVEAYDQVNPDKKLNIIKKAIKIAVPIAVILILIYFFVILPMGQHTTEDGVFAMKITGVDVSESGGSYNYAVHGESYNMPSNSASYFMNLKFFDANENLAYEVNSTADEFKSGIIWQGNIPNGEVTHIDFKLTDLNGNLLSNETYAIE